MQNARRNRLSGLCRVCIAMPKGDLQAAKTPSRPLLLTEDRATLLARSKAANLSKSRMILPFLYEISGSGTCRLAPRTRGMRHRIICRWGDPDSRGFTRVWSAHPLSPCAEKFHPGTSKSPLPPFRKGGCWGESFHGFRVSHGDMKNCCEGFAGKLFGPNKAA